MNQKLDRSNLHRERVLPAESRGAETDQMKEELRRMWPGSDVGLYAGENLLYIGTDINDGELALGLGPTTINVGFKEKVPLSSEASSYLDRELEGYPVQNILSSGFEYYNPEYRTYIVPIPALGKIEDKEGNLFPFLVGAFTDPINKVICYPAIKTGDDLAALGQKWGHVLDEQFDESYFGILMKLNELCLELGEKIGESREAVELWKEVVLAEARASQNAIKIFRRSLENGEWPFNEEGLEGVGLFYAIQLRNSYINMGGGIFVDQVEKEWLEKLTRFED